MSEILLDEVPAVDLKDFIADESVNKSVLRQNFVQTLGEAFKNIGFVAVKNHGLSDAMTQDLYRTVQEFFALPEATKLKYQIAGIGGQRGYTARGKEHAKGRSVGDLKEFYHVGQEIAEADLARLFYPKNVFPSEVAEFSTATVAAYRTLEATGMLVAQSDRPLSGTGRILF